MMRRLLIAVSVFLCAFGSASAARAQSIGFKLGASVADQDIEPDAARQALSAFAGGGFLRFAIGRAGVQLEVLSLTKGSEAETGARHRVDYIEVPLLLHLPLTAGGSWAPYIIAGPSIAFDVDCETETTPGEFTECGEREKTDYGLSAGGGLGFALGPGALLLEGRYTWGLRDVSATAGVEIRNRAAVFIAGYEIPIGRRF